MGERHSERERDEHDWYVEPAWCAEDLFRRVPFEGAIHDPCCGIGTIPREAHIAGLEATASDLVERTSVVGSAIPARDFLADWRHYPNIVTNPPYSLAHRMATHALETAYDRVAFLTQLKFLASQRRFPLWSQVERVIIYSKRPSMPPGKQLMLEGESCRGGGSIDFCWIVWEVSHEGPATIEWSMGT